MTPEMKAEIMRDKAHYEQALRRIEWKHTETNGMFCNGYFAKVAKEYHVKVTYQPVDVFSRFIDAASKEHERLWTKVDKSEYTGTDEEIMQQMQQEYISNAYLKKEVDDAYDQLKIELSEIDAEYRVAVDSTDDKTIIVADSALKFLEKFGLNVIVIFSNHFA